MQTVRNLFLVGMMGAGKTTVGRQLAAQTGLRFADSDHEIEARTGVKVATIFEIEGESGFRRRECEMIDALTQEDGIVLATGGGAVLDPGNRERLRTRGFVVYLHSRPRELWVRTRNDRSRPILQGPDPRTRLQELYDLRDPLYREVAHLVIDTGSQSVATLLGDLLPKLPAECKRSA